MSELGKIEITITDENVGFTSTFSLPEVNFWLDRIKFLILSGELEASEE